MDRRILAGALACFFALLPAGCGAAADLSGDYEALLSADGFPDHVLLMDGGTAYIDGDRGTWKARESGTLTVTLSGEKREFGWERDGYRLTLMRGDAACGYIDSVSFASDDSAQSVAGRWCDDLGQTLLALDGGGTGLYIEGATGTRDALSWQARDGLLRLQYDAGDGIEYEYLRFDFVGACLRLCAYGEDPEGDYAVVMSPPDAGAVWEGVYRFMAVSTGEEDMPLTLILSAGGGVSLDDVAGTWTRYANGVTVLDVNGISIPTVLAAGGETLLMVETLTDTAILWAREDTFAPSAEGAFRLRGARWQNAGGDTLTLSEDGGISIDWDGRTFEGTAAVSESLIRVEDGETVEYIRYTAGEDGVRMAWGAQALDDADTWPLFTAPGGQDE